MKKTKKVKKPSAIHRVFAIADVDKGLLRMSVVSAVFGYMSSIIPFVSVFYIASEFLMPATGMVNHSLIIQWIIVAGISIITNMIFSFLGSYGCHYVAFNLVNAFKVRVMEHLGKLPMHYYHKRTSGGIQKTIDECGDRIENFVGHMLPDLIGSIFVVLSLVIGVVLLSPWLALTVLLTVIVAVGIQMTVFGPKSQQIWKDVFAADQKMTGAFSEYVKGMAEVKLFGITGRMSKSLEENINQYSKWEFTSYKKSAIPMGLYKSIILSILSFILPVGLILISHSPTSQTYLMVLMALIITPAIYDPLMTCLSYGTQMVTFSVGLDAVEEVFAEQSLHLVDEAVKLEHSDVTFEDVRFSYQREEEQPTYVIRGISFTAHQGKMTALVGVSGGGKSTIGQLISRFYDVNDEEGRILIGGVEIKKIPYERLMDHIAYVLQDTYIFSGSIYDNITMNRQYEQEEVERAARAAQCHEFILSTGEGYQTKLGNGGIRLSGGETQRISIARAILKDAPIIILDEALAYSDAENENLIQSALVRLTKNKTVIIIAHRLQSIMGADQIIVLKQGEIIESGTHVELMSRESEYKELWELQHKVDDFTLCFKEEGEE